MINKSVVLIEGASRLLKEKRIKHIFFEESKERMSTLGISLKNAKDLLSSCGYAIRKVGPNDWHAIVCSKKITVTENEKESVRGLIRIVFISVLFKWSAAVIQIRRMHS